MTSSLAPVELFHLGPPKTATTWLYHCLREHPQIITSKRDTIHYFDIHFAKGYNWYDSQFEKDRFCKNASDAIRFDPTYSYICCPKSISRIANYNPNAKMVYCLRDPVERAFSHYWHIKKQIGSRAMRFSDIISHYNNYATWMEHGLLAPAMRVLYDHFPKKNILAISYEEQGANPDKIWQLTTALAGIDQNFIPPSLHKKVNVAGAKTSLPTRISNKILRSIMSEEKIVKLSNTSPFIRTLSGKSEYIAGIDKELEAELLSIIEPDIKAMEDISSLDLSHWRK